MYISKDNKAWLAAYIYYAEPWEKLLTEAIKPFAEKVLEEKLAEQFFFIRYWEKGPHIRLRFKGEEKVLEEKVKPLLTAHFEKYFAESPSQRQEPEWLKTAPEENKWYPNNSVQYIDYEPETDRYGGDACLYVSEEHFQASSESIMSIISESDEWDYSRALGSAIQLHLGFAYGLGMDLNEASVFFSRVFQSWLPRAYYFFEPDISKEELESRKQETLKAFEANFDSQKASLLPFFETVWEALNQGQEFEQEWLNKWVSDIQSLGIKLKALQENGGYIVPKGYGKPLETEGFPLEHAERWMIYDSYIHMVNNRLGVMNRDEGYLGYLIKESFNALGVKN